MNKPLAPHIRTEARTGHMMLDILLAALPLGVFSYVNYGLRPVILLLISMGTAILCEALCCLVGHRPLRTVMDGSAAVTGLLIGLLMSPMVDYWVPMLGAAFAIIVVKAPFGGFGRNVFNPAAAGIAVLTFCFPRRMFSYPAISTVSTLPLSMTVEAGEAVVEQSLAAQLRAGATPSLSKLQLLLGDFAGPIGATAALILGAFIVYLLFRRSVSPWTVIPYFVTCAVIAWLFPLTGMGRLYSAMAQLCAGYVLFTGVFFLNDPVTTPRFWLGRLFYGFFTAILVMLLQRIGRAEAGSCFAILIMNALSPIIDRWSWHVWHWLMRLRHFRKEVKAHG
ncbi:MAG: RnfABCDGE type electron transport complex subunit D [Clostridia bacterium]|nr:RnfABCDGE type electron transport complex subunit D [Clostridia bacterium]